VCAGGTQQTHHRDNTTPWQIECKPNTKVQKLQKRDKREKTRKGRPPTPIQPFFWEGHDDKTRG
jgi:hypothetical protein